MASAAEVTVCSKYGSHGRLACWTCTLSVSRPAIRHGSANSLWKAAASPHRPQSGGHAVRVVRGRADVFCVQRPKYVCTPDPPTARRKQQAGGALNLNVRI